MAGYNRIIKYWFFKGLTSNIVSASGSKLLGNGKDLKTENPFRYAGYVYDEESKLYYAGARYYDPNIGRFTTRDSEQSENQYAYVENDPVNNTDPDGNFSWKGLAKGAWYGIKEISGYNDVERAIKNPTPANIGWAALNFVPIGKVAKVGKIAYKGAKAIKAAKKAEKAAVKIGKAAARCNCFVAGTKVPTDHGEKNIEDIEVGDMVLSKDETTGEVAYKEVTATFNHETDEIYKIYVGDQTIESTYNHPFWVNGKGWTLVKEQREALEKAVHGLASGNTSGLNVHRLTNGTWAADVKGIGKGRGQGRIVYTEKNGVINIIEVTTKHYSK